MCLGSLNVTAFSIFSHRLQSTLGYPPPSGTHKFWRIIEGGGKSNEAVNRKLPNYGNRFDTFDGGFWKIQVADN